VKPVICFITDRRRFGDAWESTMIDRVRTAARAGVHLIQVRERDLEGGPLARLTERCVEAVHGTHARVVVNDRLDVALAAGAHGVHLRGDSMDASRARRLAPAGFLIGRSVHGVDEAVGTGASGSVDYLICGTVFQTTSKPGGAPAGLDQLAAVAAATTVPVLAIGGMSPRRAADVARTGAAGLAAIGLFSDCAVEALHDIVEQIVFAFDTLGRLP